MSDEAPIDIQVFPNPKPHAEHEWQHLVDGHWRTVPDDAMDDDPTMGEMAARWGPLRLVPKGTPET